MFHGVMDRRSNVSKSRMARTKEAMFYLLTEIAFISIRDTLVVALISKVSCGNFYCL
jgi:hypothetical protein